MLPPAQPGTRPGDSNEGIRQLPPAQGQAQAAGAANRRTIDFLQLQQNLLQRLTNLTARPVTRNDAFIVPMSNAGSKEEE